MTFNTEKLAEVELMRLRGEPWPITRTSGKPAEPATCGAAEIAWLAAQIGGELIVDAGRVYAIHERRGGGFGVEPPSIEIYDDYRE